VRASARSLAVFITITVAATLVLLAAPANADPARGSQGTIVCGGTTYNVISPGNRSVTASDTNSKSEVLLILDKDPTFPTNLLTLCTAYPPPPDQPFQAYFFITPAGP
jgi:hypothetical protein